MEASTDVLSVAEAESAMSSFNEAEEMLTASPMLVGGVEDEDWSSEEWSTVIALATECAGDARVSSSREIGREGDSILSRSAENIATTWMSRYSGLVVVDEPERERKEGAGYCSEIESADCLFVAGDKEAAETKRTMQLQVARN